MTLPELLLTFTASLLASVHCAAMCGGFSLSLVRAGEAGRSAARLAAYHAGKLFTYVFLGLLAGVAGAALLNSPALQTAQVALSALAGVLIVIVGLQTLGLLRGQNVINRLAETLWLGPFLGPIFSIFRDRATADGAFFLGLFNGFLPCGLVYSFALAAAGTGSVGAAMLTMLAFGLGTVPMLVAVGVGGAALAGLKALRPTLMRAAGVLVVALGLLTVVRGTPLITTFAASGGQTGHDHTGLTVSGAMDMGVELEPAPAPAFALTNQDGQPVSLSSFHGRVVLLDFIYTSCTDTCPLLTAKLRAIQDRLGSDFPRNVALVSVTVDPATDTPAVLKAFGEKYGADFSCWDFLTGSQADIELLSSAYAVYVQRQADSIDHTETILLIDGHGQLRAAFGLQADPGVIVAKARQLIHSH